jgi:hypothetical protein
VLLKGTDTEAGTFSRSDNGANGMPKLHLGAGSERRRVIPATLNPLAIGQFAGSDEASKPSEKRRPRNTVDQDQFAARSERAGC